MKSVGLLGPIDTNALAEFLPGGPKPRGLGGTPVNLQIAELLRRGREVRVFSLDPSVTEPVLVEGHGIRIWFAPMRPKRARDFFREEIRQLSDLVRRDKPAVLHAHWTYEFGLAALSVDSQAVVTAHDAPWTVLRYGFQPYRIARTAMALRCIPQVRRLAAVSPYIERHLRRWCGARAYATIIPNGLPEESFNLHAAHRTRATTIATVGAWGKLKNVSRLLEAFATVRKRLPGAQLHLFGHGLGKGEAGEAWARNRGLHDGVEFFGNTPYRDLMRHLAGQVDVYAHPSLEEAHPMAITEAMALGLPIIGGKSSGAVPWTLAEGDCGLLVEVRSADQLAAAICRLLSDDGLRKTIGERARQYAREHYHIGRVVDDYEKMYG